MKLLSEKIFLNGLTVYKKMTIYFHVKGFSELNIIYDVVLGIPLKPVSREHPSPNLLY